MNGKKDKLLIVLRKGGNRIFSQIPLKGVNRVVFVYNRQFTNSPNTTQIASGAGKSSAAGSNAAIASPYTFQQQSVGAGGKASNIGMQFNRKNNRKGRMNGKNKFKRGGKEVVVVINDQIAKYAQGTTEAAATQIASGGGKYSTGGTNSAIDSKGTKQQHAVGGGSGSISRNKLLRSTRTTRKIKK